MMRDVNKVILIGRLGNDPVQRETRNGKVVVNFSLATSRRLKPDGEAVEAPLGLGAETRPPEETIWHRVVSWGKQGEFCARYLKKGRTVFVEGALRSRKYVDREGISRTAFEVHADNVLFLGGGRFAPPREEEIMEEAEVVS